MVKIGILGLGEAGRIFAEDLIAQSNEVIGFDPAPVPTPEGVTRAQSAKEAATGVDIVFSLVTAQWAPTVCAEIANVLSESTIVVDLNSGAPETKHDGHKALGDKGHLFVDGAIMGSVPGDRLGVQVLLAGPAAQRAAELMNTAGGNAQAIADTVGVASQRKLMRSVFVKSLGALIVETYEAADAFGDREFMDTVIAQYLAGGTQVADRLARGTKLHAARRSHEVADALAMVSSGGGSWPMIHGALEQHKRLAAGPTNEAEILTRLAAIPTSALGDGQDRLGFVDSSVCPVWGSPTIAGRALTVMCQPGDNSGVHAALKIAKPGDILIVAGGGFTDRALMGELIAERCRNAGITAFITDGAVRDRDDLEEKGFPVWSAGLSPAGPFKVGPHRLKVPVSLGGAVCNPGDYVVADCDGVLFIPPQEVTSWIIAGEAVLAEEARRLETILSARGGT